MAPQPANTAAPFLLQTSLKTKRYDKRLHLQADAECCSSTVVPQGKVVKTVN